MNTPKAPANAGPAVPADPTDVALPAGTDQIVVVPYDIAWPQRFTVESQLIQMVLADLQPAVEHIGSTSVPGLAAKPIIDVLVGVRSLEDFGRHLDLLTAYGYQYIPEYERVLPDRRFFKRVVRGARTHHVHVVEFGGLYWQRYVAFRDSLRQDAHLAERYAELKRGLAVRHRHDRDAYTNGKTGFVESVLARRSLSGKTGAKRPRSARCNLRNAMSTAVLPGGRPLGFRPHFSFAS